MRGFLLFFDPLTHRSLTGMPGHSASRVPQVLLLMRNSRTKPPIWLLPSRTELVSFLRTASELSPEEKTLWIQSGLAVSPLMGTCLQHFLGFCLAWALIGEWTSRVLFPVPKGPWPRHGDAGALLQNYKCRSPRIVAWARAAFEQGALPSLFMMPGHAPVLSLPGDCMFQAKDVAGGHQRPAIIHAYGGAKASMERSLASIAPKGGFLWRLLCSALWTNRLCGQVLGFAQLSAQPSTSIRKRRNCSCSRVGNIGMQPVSRTLLCPNGLLELMWNMDPMGLAPLPF